MAGLNPYYLSLCNTLAEIEEKITFYSTKLEGATVKLYDKDTTQGRQRVESAELSQIEDILGRWIAAKVYKSGAAGPNIVSADYRPIEQRGRGF